MGSEDNFTEAVAIDTSHCTINNLLCFNTTSMNTKTHDVIIQCCLPFYNVSEIRTAKELIFSFTDERCVSRRGDNSTRKDLEDIIQLLVKIEENKINIPKFLCNSFDGMPPSSEFELISNKLISLTEEIFELREELKVMRESNIKQNIIMDDIKQVKDDVSDIFHSVRDLKLKFFESEIKRTSVSFTDKIMHMPTMPTAPPLSQDCAFFTPDVLKENNVLSDCSTPTLLKENNNKRKLSCNEPYSPTVKSNKNSNIKNSSSSNLNVNINTEPSSINDDGWKLVQNKKYKHKHKENDRIIGRRESPGKKLTSAIRLYDMFIGNCSLETSENDIIDYIREEAKVTVFKCSQLSTRRNDYKCFKVSLNLMERDKLLDGNIWPKGIFCRKFYRSKQDLA